MNSPEDSSILQESPLLYDSEAMLAEARRLPECSWFRNPEATVDNRDDVVLVIRHLREYGGHRAWRAAKQLWKKCR